MTALIIRWFHVLGMAFILGGSALLAATVWRMGPDSEAAYRKQILLMAKVYEVGFWIALGVVVMTGIGNVGAFGKSLPDLSEPWGITFSGKLALVLVFSCLSLLRTLFVSSLTLDKNPLGSSAAWRIIRGAYVGTLAFAIGLLGLAISLSHGHA
ncbi:MAG: CopD family protein [Nitrospiraceae bacterium]